MRKPTVTTNPVANQYAGPAERIIEYSAGELGGLISLRSTDDGRLIVEPYRHDNGVEIRTARPAVLETIPTPDGNAVTATVTLRFMAGSDTLARVMTEQLEQLLTELAGTRHYPHPED